VARRDRGEDDAQTLATAKSVVSSLGYTRREAERLVESVRHRFDEETAIEMAVREALRAAPLPGHPMRVSEAFETYGSPRNNPPRGGLADPPLPAFAGYGPPFAA
jgi:hypothetical protein